MSKLTHGGRLRQAAIDYQIPLSDWLDLSTGVSPWMYPFNDVEQSAWNRLPEENDGLEEAAKKYYGCSSLLPVAGSQAAIQQIPRVWSEHIDDSTDKSKSKPCVGLPYQGYKEHEQAWRKAGWNIIHYQGYPRNEEVEKLNALVVINPNNPMGHSISKEALLGLSQLLSCRNGLLVIDEAFADCDKQQSLSQLCPMDNLIVLRSVGKFFGLAGIRVGFVLAQESILDGLGRELGPWTIAGPSRAICEQALSDRSWHSLQKQRLIQASHRLHRLLRELGGKFMPDGDDNLSGTCLFQTWYIPNAESMHHKLCLQGVFVRLTDEKNALRFGLPMNEYQWEKLSNALTKLDN